MIALSVKNPWAFLVCSGIKPIENRTWPTNFRGRVLIHASGKLEYPTLTIQQREEISNRYIDLDRADLTSVILGSVEIIDCVQNHPSIWAEKGTVNVFSKAKKAIIEKPIYNLVLANPILFPTPIPNVKGSLSFWNYDGQIPLVP